MRMRFATVIAALACTGLGQASERVREPPEMIYHCDHTIQNLEGTNGRLYLIKQFRRDGSPLGLFVELEGSSGAIAHFRTPGNRIDMTLRWPGDHLVRLVPAPFSWTDGSIEIHFYGEENRLGLREGERWRQVVVDRHGSVIIHERDGVRMLSVNRGDFHLVSELQPLSSAGHLWTSLDGLLAWGSGVERLTVYETMITPRRHNPNDTNDTSVDWRRIVGQYEIDMSALSQLVAQVRTAVTAWEAELTDLPARCELRHDDSGDIIVT